MIKRLFITDFDGTLLRDDKSIDPADILALQRLGQYGIIRAVATGRSVYSFKTIIEQLGYSGYDNPLPVDFVILSTGSEIMTFPEFKLLQSHCLKADEVIDIIDYFEKNSFDYMIHRPYPETKRFVYKSHGSWNPDFFARIKLYKKYCKPLIKENLKVFGKATQVLSIVPRGKARGITQKAREQLNDFSVIKATSPLDGRSIWIEVFPASVSKSRAAAWLARSISIKQQSVVSVGNDYNDMDLLSWSGKGYVVDNAPFALKEKFETVASNNGCGVSEAIYKQFGIHCREQVAVPHSLH